MRTLVMYGSAIRPRAFFIAMSCPAGIVGSILTLSYRRRRGAGERRWSSRRSARVVEDDAHRVAKAPPHATDAVTHGSLHHAAVGGHRTLIYRQDHGVALRKPHHIGTLLPCADVGHDELTALEVCSRFRE